MTPRRRPLLALALLAVLASGVCGCFNPFRPLVSGLTSFVKPPPSPTNPQELVRLFKWCWENRDITQYREIFTDDYRFAFAIDLTWRFVPSATRDWVQRNNHLQPPVNRERRRSRQRV